MTIQELRQRRKASGFTQFEISERSGVERCRLSLAECGRVRLHEHELVAIEKALLEAINHRVAALQRELAAAVANA